MARLASLSGQEYADRYVTEEEREERDRRTGTEPIRHRAMRKIRQVDINAVVGADPAQQASSTCLTCWLGASPSCGHRSWPGHPDEQRLGSPYGPHDNAG